MINKFEIFINFKLFILFVKLKINNNILEIAFLIYHKELKNYMEKEIYKFI